MRFLARTVFTLAVALQSPQDPSELVRGLGADRLEDRADAEKALVFSRKTFWSTTASWGRPWDSWTHREAFAC